MLKLFYRFISWITLFSAVAVLAVSSFLWRGRIYEFFVNFTTGNWILTALIILLIIFTVINLNMSRHPTARLISFCMVALPAIFVVFVSVLLVISFFLALKRGTDILEFILSLDEGGWKFSIDIAVNVIIALTGLYVAIAANIFNISNMKIKIGDKGNIGDNVYDHLGRDGGIIEILPKQKDDLQQRTSTVPINEKEVTENVSEVVNQIIKSAEEGDTTAQYKLALIYNEGQEGILQNYITAHMWFNLAAASGHESAKSMRNEIARKMTPNQIADAQNLASKWESKK